MSQLPFYLLAFVGALSVLVVVHELGHYTVARWCGVKVLRFSFGFGRVLWSRRSGADGTEWSLSAIPLGGYVKMLDEREGPVAPAERHRAFNSQGVGRRSLIVVAGPFANFLLALVLYWFVFLYGSNELLPILGAPPADTPAAAAQVHNGETVRAVDGEAVATWNDLRWLLLRKAVDQDGATLETINERGEIAFHRLSLRSVSESGWEGDVFAHLGLRFYRPDAEPVIGKVMAGSPAADAGLQAGDRLLAIDGKDTRSWLAFVAIVREAPGRSLHIAVQRGSTVFERDIVPEAAEEGGRRIGRIGVAVMESEAFKRELHTRVHYGFWESGRRALAETWDKSVFSLVMFGKMLVGEVSWKNLSGPVTIADYAGQSARLGLDYYLKFVALVSISLGVLNLLPVPVLDGGHLMYHMMEVVRRRPLSEQAMETGQRVGMALLFILMAFAFFNDLTRLFSG